MAILSESLKTTTKQNLKRERSGFIGFTNEEGKLTDEEKRANRRGKKHKIGPMLIKKKNICDKMKFTEFYFYMFHG